MFKSPSLRRLVPWVLAFAGAAAAGSAQAGGVHWSIGINLPAPPVVYAPPPAVVYAPPPVVYEPRPVRYYSPPPVVYEPRPVRYYSPPPAVYYRPVREEWCPPRGHGHRDHDRWEGRRGWRGDRY